MKKILFALLAGLIPAMAITHETYAQTSDAIASANPVNHDSKMLSPGVSGNSNTIAPNLVTFKALKHFRKNYKANDEKWGQGTDCFTASYSSNGIGTTIHYNKKGNWVGSVIVYKEDKLPKDIRKLVKQVYYDYKIVLVYEIETTTTKLSEIGITYIVTIEDDKNIKLIRVQDDNMDVYQEFNKSK
jgi:hypothetical protein